MNKWINEWIAAKRELRHLLALGLQASRAGHRTPIPTQDPLIWTVTYNMILSPIPIPSDEYFYVIRAYCFESNLFLSSVSKSFCASDFAWTPRETLLMLLRSLSTNAAFKFTPAVEPALSSPLHVCTFYCGHPIPNTGLSTVMIWPGSLIFGPLLSTCFISYLESVSSLWLLTQAFLISRH